MFYHSLRSVWCSTVKKKKSSVELKSRTDLSLEWEFSFKHKGLSIKGRKI